MLRVNSRKRALNSLPHDGPSVAVRIAHDVHRALPGLPPD